MTPIEQIKERLNILDVVSSYTELHKSGRNFKGLSPFTTEKTPSFYVTPEKGMYYCFSTNQGGDIFDFIETLEGVDFKGALKILAEKAGVELVPEKPGERDHRDRLYSICTEATKLFQQNLKAQPSALKYLTDRGVSVESIAHWSLGLAVAPPEGWRQLRSTLAAQKFTDAEMLEAGVIKKPDDTKEPFDVFRDRIIFPLRDQAGRVVAFSGRDLSGSDKAPKYVNSPETPLYHKSSLLYGYDFAKEAARKSDFWLLVEGQFDVVLAHQIGFKNTIAVSGTALTAAHIELMQRLSSRVVLALDSDRAGVAAMEKAARLMLPKGIDIKVALLAEGQDPADMIKNDPDSFKQAVRQSKTVVEYFLTHYQKHSKDSRSYKLVATDALIPLVSSIPNHIDQDHFVGVMAEALDTTKDAVRFELERYVKSQKTAAKAIPEPVQAKKPTTSKDTMATEKLDNFYQQLHYLLVAAEVLPKVGDFVIRELTAQIGQEELDLWRTQMSKADRAMFTVTIEEFSDTQSDNIIYDDIIHRLNICLKNAKMRQLKHLRDALSEAGADEAKGTALLAELLAAQKELQKPALTVADLLTK